MLLRYFLFCFIFICYKLTCTKAISTPCPDSIDESQNPQSASIHLSDNISFEYQSGSESEHRRSLSPTTQLLDNIDQELSSKSTSETIEVGLGSRDWLTKGKKALPRGWLDIVKSHSNYVPNLDQTRILWKPTNPDSTEYVLGVENAGVRGIAQLWITGHLQWVNLTSIGEYKTWNVKLAIADQDTTLLANFLSTYGVLQQTWSKSTLTGVLSLSAKQVAVARQLQLMDDGEERSQLQTMSEAGHYPLAYNGVSQTNPDPGCDLDLFERGSFVAVEFQIHSHSFAASKKRGASIGYTFRLQSVYLVEDKVEEIATPKKRKAGPDEWLHTPPRNKKSRMGDNPLEFSISKSK